MYHLLSRDLNIQTKKITRDLLCRSINTSAPASHHPFTSSSIKSILLRSLEAHVSHKIGKALPIH